jgi:dTDP-4-dehydrorhamnose 3,5-epimerase
LNVYETSLPGVKVIEPAVFGDPRGWFMETYSHEKFEKLGLTYNFVQDNQSYSSTKGTLRGLHYQLEPKAQTKLVRCTRGAIYDIAVDIRNGSPTFGKWFGIEISEKNKKQLLIPKGFAHGFITLVDDVEVQYKVDELYAPDCDRGILWNDPAMGIEWPIHLTPVLSEKDKLAPLLENADSNFIFGE